MTGMQKSAECAEEEMSMLLPDNIDHIAFPAYVLFYPYPISTARTLRQERIEHVDVLHGHANDDEADDDQNAQPDRKTSDHGDRI